MSETLMARQRLQARAWSMPHLRNENSCPSRLKPVFQQQFIGRQRGTLLFTGIDGIFYVLTRRDFTRLAAFETWLRKYPGVQVVLTQGLNPAVSLDDLRAYFSSDIQNRIVGTLGQTAQFTSTIEAMAKSVNARKWMGLIQDMPSLKDRPPWMVIVDPRKGLQRTHMDRLSDLMSRPG